MTEATEKDLKDLGAPGGAALCEVCGRSADVCNAGRINHDPYELAAHYALGYEREKARAAKWELIAADTASTAHEKIGVLLRERAAQAAPISPSDLTSSLTREREEIAALQDGNARMARQLIEAIDARDKLSRSLRAAESELHDEQERHQGTLALLQGHDTAYAKVMDERDAARVALRVALGWAYGYLTQRGLKRHCPECHRVWDDGAPPQHDEGCVLGAADAALTSGASATDRAPPKDTE